MEHIVENHEIDEAVTTDGIELFDRVGELVISYEADDNEVFVDSYASFQPYNSDTVFEIEIDIYKYLEAVEEDNLNCAIMAAENAADARAGR